MVRGYLRGFFWVCRRLRFLQHGIHCQPVCWSTRIRTTKHFKMRHWCWEGFKIWGNELFEAKNEYQWYEGREWTGFSKVEGRSWVHSQPLIYLFCRQITRTGVKKRDNSVCHSVRPSKNSPPEILQKCKSEGQWADEGKSNFHFQSKQKVNFRPSILKSVKKWV